MKNSKNLIIAVFVLGALLVGFLLGVFVDYPKFNQYQVSGTIGKVDNYRNTKVTEADIELKNDLVTDTTKLKSLQTYLSFYYVNAAKMTSNVAFALKEAGQVETFNTAYKTQIDALNNYATFLESARSSLLLAKLVCLEPDNTDPIVLRNQLNNAKNVVAQLNYRDQVVLDFVDNLAVFINTGKPGKYAALEKAHDLLALTEFQAALITKNKLVLKFLDKTKLLGKGENSLGWSWDQPMLFDNNLKADIDDLKNEYDSNSTKSLEYNDQAYGMVTSNLQDISAAMYKFCDAMVQDGVGGDLSDMSNANGSISNVTELDAFGNTFLAGESGFFL